MMHLVNLPAPAGMKKEAVKKVVVAIKENEIDQILTGDQTPVDGGADR
jgi:hypothetical protein